MDVTANPTPALEPAAAEVPQPSAPSRRRRPRPLNPTGCWIALLLGCLSFTPSLLPRSWIFQAVLTGVSAALGYGIGVAASALFHYAVERPARVVSRRRWIVLGTVSVIAVLIFTWLGAHWQEAVHRLSDVAAPERISWVAIPVVGLLVAVLILAIARGLRWVGIRLGGFLGRWLRPQAARVLGGLLVALLALGFAQGVLYDGALNVADSYYSTRDTGTPPGVVAPSTGLRSGGPRSLVPWDTLGSEGRKFIGSGPTVAQLTAFQHAPAKAPIRAYAGIASAADPQQRAHLAVADLERAGGFGRKVLVVATTTGTGWIDPSSVDTVEYMFGGDTAVVGIQYSYLPSWISFLVDQSKAKDAGRMLFDAVYGVWARMPAAQRPRLFVFGESLGSFGGESAFSGAEDITNRTDGVVWVGPPNMNTLWQRWTTARQPGTPEIRPVYKDGQTVRWVNSADQLTQTDGWQPPRVLYVQHASDPIVWWSPNLLLHRPDWLTEPRGSDVSPDVQYIPLVTFFMLAADMTHATGVPAGHGHHYGPVMVDAWAAVTQPPGWTQERAQLLRQIIAK